MTLPNATTKTYPQPNAEWPDAAGTTHLLAVPGVPSVVRTTAQAAADAAAGHQWRNVAMLSGGKQQLYGRDLSGWIYIDPSGARWHMEFDVNLNDVAFPFSGGLSLGITATRFGVFGATLESHSYSVSLTDWGQQGYPALTGFQSAGGGVDSITDAHLLVDGLYSDGSKLALMVHHRRLHGANESDTTVDLTIRHPLGWLQLALSGPGGSLVVTLTVLKNRSQVTFDVSHYADTVTASTFYPPAPHGPFTARVGTRNFEFKFSRLMACAPNESIGGWKWMAYRHTHNGNTSASLTQAGSNFNNTSVREHFFTAELVLDGVAICSSQIHSTEIKTRQIRFLASADGLGNWWYIDDHGYSGETNFDGSVTTESVTTTSTTPGPSGNYLAGVTILLDDGFVYGASYTPEQSIFTSAWRKPCPAITYGLPSEMYVDFCRYSGGVFGFRFQIGTDSRHRHLATFDGASLVDVTRPFSVTERLYSSWCPHTGQVASLSMTPVCWV